MDIMGFMAGTLGFVFAIIATNQVAMLKKELDKLRAEIEQKTTQP
jgi:hypothetical protein